MTRDHLGDQAAAGAQNARRLAQGCQAILGIRQVIQGSHEQDCVEGCIIEFELPSIAENASSTPACGLLGPREEAGNGIDEHDLVATIEQVRRMRPGTSSHIGDAAHRWQEALEDVPGAEPNELANATPPETFGLDPQFVVAKDTPIRLHRTRTVP